MFYIPPPGTRIPAPTGGWSGNVASMLAVLNAPNLDLPTIEHNLVTWAKERRAYTLPGQKHHHNDRYAEQSLIHGTGLATTKGEHVEITQVATGHALARSIPAAFLDDTLDAKLDLARKITALTHPHEVVILSAQLYVTALHLALTAQRKATPSDICVQAYQIMDERADHPAQWAYFGLLGRHEPVSIDFAFPDPYVIATLVATFSVFASTVNPIHACVTAGKLGGPNTYLIGGLAGALAGAYYGIRSWPSAWVASFHKINVNDDQTTRPIRDLIAAFDQAQHCIAPTAEASGGIG